MIYPWYCVPEDAQAGLAYGVLATVAIFVLIWAGCKLLTFLRRRGGRARSRRRA